MGVPSPFPQGLSKRTLRLHDSDMTSRPCLPYTIIVNRTSNSGNQIRLRMDVQPLFRKMQHCYGGNQ